METLEKTRATIKNSKKVVEGFLEALNNEDFDKARSYLDDHFKFDGVMGSRDGAGVYIGDMKKMKFKYKVLKAFSEGDDVSVLYDINMQGPAIYSSGWYRLRNGKIISLKVVFDPRSLEKK